MLVICEAAGRSFIGMCAEYEPPLVCFSLPPGIASWNASRLAVTTPETVPRCCMGDPRPVSTCTDHPGPGPTLGQKSQQSPSLLRVYSWQTRNGRYFILRNMAVTMKLTAARDEGPHQSHGRTQADQRPEPHVSQSAALSFLGRRPLPAATGATIRDPALLGSSRTLKF